MAVLPIINKLELHYFFTDASHTMDAYVRNKCDTELLAIIREVASLTGIRIKVETEPYVEGGLKERIKLITKNQFLLPILSGIITGVITGVISGVTVQHLSTDAEFDELQKQKLKLEIKKLERELNEANRSSVSLNTSKAADSISSNSFKIAKHKSNFYKALNNYSKVTHVSFTRLSSENEAIGLPKIIERKDFGQFILDSDELPSVIDEQAEIEIISPVLKPGPYKWKGYYTAIGETIDFYMKDKEFKNDILSKGLAFRNGSRIDCILEITRKITETGEVVYASFSASTVLSVRDGETTIETNQGKKLKKESELLKNQLTLSFDNLESSHQLK